MPDTPRWDVIRAHSSVFRKKNPVTNMGRWALKESGELPIDGAGVRPVLNAIENALGIAVDEIPLLPEIV